MRRVKDFAMLAAMGALIGVAVALVGLCGIWLSVSAAELAWWAPSPDAWKAARFAAVALSFGGLVIALFCGEEDQS